jgi:hypothetical protein
MRTIQILLFLALSLDAFSQNTDPLSYHTARQLSDSSYSIKKANGDSTLFIFEGNSMPDLSGRNYANDSIAVVTGGLKMWDYYRTGNIVKIVTTLPANGFPVSSDFNYVVDNVDGTSADQAIRIDGYSGNFNIIASWGDGTVDHFSGGEDYMMTHSYSSNSVYNPVFTISDYSLPNEIYIYQGNDVIKVKRINNISIFNALNLLELANSSLANADSLIYPSGLTYLGLGSTNISSFNPVTSLPAGLKLLDINWDNLTIFSPAVGIPASLTTLNLKGNLLTTSEVNNTLVWLNGLTFNAGPKTLDIRQRTSAPPSGAGLTALSSLTSKGWTITHD